MPEPTTIWKRRVALMAIIGLLIAIPVTIAVRGGEDSEPTTTPAPIPEVGEVQFDRDVGVELRLPKGWKRKREGEAVTYRSRDGSAIIGISIPGPEEDVDAVQEAAVEAVKQEYRDVEVVKQTDKRRLGDRPATTALITAKHPETKAPIQIVVATAKGERYAYLVEIFASGGKGLLEAQVLLNNIRLEG